MMCHKNAFAIVNSGCEEGVDQSFISRERVTFNVT